ncbi:hypothetical protein IIA95_03370, partial [Patescibacteria group bacterium]|nr:hypothetical protein [Patescibacteria group bacterium]
APLISEICDIRRFATAAKLKAFCGVHVLPDGRFPRQRKGEETGWEDQRQALVLLGKQFNYRPNSFWGKKLLEIKRGFRRRHPEVVIVNAKKRYTDGHILKMALWRTLTKFVEWLFREWWRLEREHQRKTDKTAA